MAKSAMIVGLGDLGGWALEFLARREGLGTIYTADIREDYGISKTNCAAVGAGHEGYDKKFQFYKLELDDIDKTAKMLENTRPDVIFTALSLKSVTQLASMQDESLTQRIEEAGMGPSLPFQLALMVKLMQAVKKSGIATHVINSSLPSMVNPVLWRNNLGVTVGMGNIDNVVGGIRKVNSEAEGVPFSEVTVFLVAHHAVTMYGTRTGAPFFLKLVVRDRNITSRYDAHSLITDRLLSVKGPALKLANWILVPAVASSAVKNIMAIINDTNEFTHSPGPNGLPGGYPIRLNAKGVEVVLPEELTLEEAIRINSEAAKRDGVEKIKDDGTVVYTDKSYNIMKEVLGYDCKELRFNEIEARAKELVSLLNKKLGE